MIHFQNISLIPNFYRTQVFPTVQNFLKFLTKIFLYKTCFVQLYFISPKAFPKLSNIFLLNISQLSLLVFQCLKLAIDKVVSRTPCSALLFTFVENELSLEP